MRLFDKKNENDKESPQGLLKLMACAPIGPITFAFLFSPKNVDASKAPLYSIEVSPNLVITRMDLPPRLDGQDYELNSAAFNLSVARTNSVAGLTFINDVPWWKHVDDLRGPTSENAEKLVASLADPVDRVLKMPLLSKSYFDGEKWVCHPSYMLVATPVDSGLNPTPWIFDHVEQALIKDANKTKIDEKLFSQILGLIGQAHQAEVDRQAKRLAEKSGFETLAVQTSAVE